MKREILLEIGRDLKKRRLQQKLKLEEIARKILINKDYLKAIETGDTKVLRFDAYTVGYVKKYANALGLDSNVYVEGMSGLVHNIDLPPVASKNLITLREFLPSPQAIIISVVLLIMLYVLVEAFV